MFKQKKKLNKNKISIKTPVRNSLQNFKFVQY